NRRLARSAPFVSQVGVLAEDVDNVEALAGSPGSSRCMRVGELNVVGSRNRGPRARQSIPWIWRGLVTSEAITLLSAPDNTGKTTPLSVLLDRRRSGDRLRGHRAMARARWLACPISPHASSALRSDTLTRVFERNPARNYPSSIDRGR